jgi:hypothetical protein
MTRPDPEVQRIGAWWQTLREHTTRQGLCVFCKVPSCEPRRTAFEELHKRGEFTLQRPSAPAIAELIERLTWWRGPAPIPDDAETDRRPTAET